MIIQIIAENHSGYFMCTTNTCINVQQRKSLKNKNNLLMISRLVAGLNDLSVYVDKEEVEPSNPFLLRKNEDTVLDIALHILETVTSRKGPRKLHGILSRISPIASGCSKLLCPGS